MLGLICAAVVLVEYGSSHPGLVEFRFAPPFNRIRFAGLAVTVVALSLMCRATLEPDPFGATVLAVGDLVGRAMDLPASPVRIVTVLLSEGEGPEGARLVRAAAGVAYLVSLLTLAFFAIATRLLHWPLRDGGVNLWVNLPTFDWTEVATIEERLVRDARVNAVFGLTLPYFIPLMASLLSGFYALEAVRDYQTLVWMLALWAFFPASLLMRAMAMARIAALLRRKRLAHGAGAAPAEPGRAEDAGKAGDDGLAVA